MNIRITVIATALWLSVLTPGVYAQSTYSRLDQLKAAFLTNFSHFIRWPQQAERSELTLCIWDQAPLQEPLVQLLHNKTIRQRALVARQVISREQALDCALIFFSQTDPIPTSDGLRHLHERAVLTVSDREGFAQNGGIIEFYIQNNKLKFIINLTAARAAGLKIDVPLLDMARIIGQP